MHMLHTENVHDSYSRDNMINNDSLMPVWCVVFEAL